MKILRYHNLHIETVEWLTDSPGLLPRFLLSATLSNKVRHTELVNTYVKSETGSYCASSG
jgi:hypothetical protein